MCAGCSYALCRSETHAFVFHQDAKVVCNMLQDGCSACIMVDVRWVLGPAPHGGCAAGAENPPAGCCGRAVSAAARGACSGPAFFTLP